MLRPQDTATRERKSLDGLWRFAFDADGVGRGEEWWNGPLPDAHEVAVPASYNDLFADPRRAITSATCGTRPSARVPAGWEGKRIVLRFDAATHRAVVWVNGTRVAEHEGGYTPFEADVSEHVVTRRGGARHRRGQQRAELAVDPARLRRGDRGRQGTCSTTTTSSTTPGCTARCGCTARPSRTSSDVTVVTGLDGSRGHASTTRSRPPPATATRCASRSGTPTATEVARGAGATGVLTVADVHPWQPGDGYLYELVAELVDGDAVVDSYPVAGRRAHRGGARHGVPDQRRAVLLHGLRPARGHPGPRQGSRRRLPRARLRADGVDRRELVPHVALPLRRGGARLRRPARHRRDRRDGRGRAEHRPGGRDLRRRGLHDVLRGDDQRRHPGGPRPGDPRAGGARQEPSERRAVEHRQRAGVPHRAARATTSSRSSP